MVGLVPIFDMIVVILLGKHLGCNVQDVWCQFRNEL
jgi:hypothetical protein